MSGFGGVFHGGMVGGVGGSAVELPPGSADRCVSIIKKSDSGTASPAIPDLVIRLTAVLIHALCALGFVCLLAVATVANSGPLLLVVTVESPQ